MRNHVRWVPAGVLSLGAAINILFVTGRVQPMPLPTPLESLPSQLLGLEATAVPVSEAEVRLAGMSSYVLRNFAPAGAPMTFQVYVGYYDEQRQGKSIHSPRNCLPGAGWETVGFVPVVLASGDSTATVNRYHLVKESEQSIVYYWYQGRGRVAHDEYRVKLELLRDAALIGRTEEALVRVWVPVVDGDIAAADSIAAKVSREMITATDAVLPPR